jgi:hypothetical protein
MCHTIAPFMKQALFLSFGEWHKPGGEERILGKICPIILRRMILSFFKIQTSGIHSDTSCIQRENYQRNRLLLYGLMPYPVQEKGHGQETTWNFAFLFP